ncbi:unnamed protein product [Zymoseptoria tritici ST99CH_3D1]|nr:unnamed protein product [Zymoseptoria tritici ST99CH_3D1]
MKAKEEPRSFPLEDKPLTRENILKCLSIAPRVPPSGWGSMVARLRSDVVVKYGQERVHINEANTMRLVRQRTSTVLLPKVLDAWTATDCGQNRRERGKEDVPVTYIVMQYVHGTVLKDKWPTLIGTERDILVQRVADMLKELRTVQVDQPGPLGQPIRCEGRYFTEYDAGPFETKADLTHWLNNRLEVCKLFRQAPQNRPELAIDELVVCHTNLNERTIVVAADGSPWIIDWTCAGGYPPCFERGSLRPIHGDAGEFARALKEKIAFEEDEPLLARLDELTFAFYTAALCRRYDMDFGRHDSEGSETDSLLGN